MNMKTELYEKISDLNKYINSNSKVETNNPIEDFKKLKSKYSEKGICEKLGINATLLFELESSFKFYEKNNDEPGNVYQIALLRTIILLSLIGDNINLDLEVKINKVNSNESIALKQTRAFELIIRSLVTEHNGGKQGILEKLKELFKSEIIKTWLKNADDTGILSGTSFNELSALFLDKKFFTSYDNFFVQNEGLSYAKNKINSLRFFLNDIRIVRNNIAHNKKVSVAQIELLNLYYIEIISRIQIAHNNGNTIVNPSNYYNVDEKTLEAYLSNITVEYEAVKSDIAELKSLSTELKNKTRLNTKLISIALLLISMLSALLFFFRTDLGLVEQRVTSVENNLKNLSDSFNNSENIYYSNPTNSIQFLSNAIVDKRKGNYTESVNNYERYFAFGDEYIDPYLDYLSILELPGYENQKKHFLERIQGSDRLIENICEILLINNLEIQIDSFRELIAANENNSLYYYFHLQSVIKSEKLNPSTNKITCEKVINYKTINDELLILKKDTSFLNLFIDKVSIQETIEEHIKYSKVWAEAIGNTIEMLKSQGLEIGNVLFSLNKLYSCSNEDLALLVAKYYDLEKTTTNKLNLSDKYYRFQDGMLIEGEYVEFVKKNELKWINETYNYNCVGSYQILNNTIVLNLSGVPVDFKIINDNTIEYNEGNQKYIYKKK